MALTPDFTIAQIALDPSLAIAEDTSTGSDVLVVSRRIYLQNSAGDYLVESGVITTYNPWALATNPISLNLLTFDQALSIKVDWMSVGGSVLYTKTQSYCLAYFNKVFFYYLQQQQGLSPGIVQDANYSSNMAVLWTTIIGAVNSVEIGNDLSASQNCLNRGTEMRLNESLYF